MRIVRTWLRDVKPVVLPGMKGNQGLEQEQKKTLPGGAAVKTRPEQEARPKVTRAQKAAVARSKSKHLGGVPSGKAAMITSGGVRYVERADAPAEEELVEKKVKKPRKPRQKNDPKLVKAARELRDRYLEQVNEGRLLPGGCGKYDVSRQLDCATATDANAEVVELKELPRLDAA